MNIHRLQTEVDKGIFNRGLDYFLAGNITKWGNLDKNTYFFHVKGSRYYEVFVQINENGDVLKSYCDCPYDFGPVCKHEIAAYMQISELIESENHLSTNLTVPATLREILQQLTKEQLIDIIIDVAQNDETFEERLIFTYAKVDESEQLESFKQLVASVIDRYTSYDGFIRYSDSFSLADELDELLHSVTQLKDIVIATDMALYMLHLTLDTFSYVDDSGGALGNVADDAVNILKDLAILSVETDKETVVIFDKILAESDKEIYDDWTDFQIDLLSIGIIFAQDESLRVKIIEKLQHLIAQVDILEYEKENLSKLLLQLKKEYGTEDELVKFMYAHLDFTSFRESLIEYYLRDGAFEKVISLAEAGEQKDEMYRGLVSKWKNYRYQALKGLSKKTEQTQLARELFFAGDFEYYNELQELTKDKDELYESLISELKQLASGYSERLLLQLVETENDLEELLQFVQRNPRAVRTYAEKLMEYDKQAVIDLYVEYIKWEAEQASNRKQYRGVCREINRFTTITGAKNVKEKLILEFKEIYKRKPAFIDELGKI